MFEKTLLIIKPDFMPSKKGILLCLLEKGFQIQGSRRLAFTPEDAAEFNKDMADNKNYMLYVILLSKGTSEAFILTREDAVDELMKEMVCFFGNSIEMEQNVHVSRSVEAARREITFIFPNYIHEPIEPFDEFKFCKQPGLGPILGEIFTLTEAAKKDGTDDWRGKLSEWLISTNASLPAITNQCSLQTAIGTQDRSQQTNPVPGLSALAPETEKSLASSSSGASSGLITSSSCVSCSSFERDDTCKVVPQQLCAFEEQLKLRAEKTLKEAADEEQTERVCDEHIEVVNVYEYEDGYMYDVTDDDFGRRIELEDEEGLQWQGGTCGQFDIDGIISWASAAEIKAAEEGEEEPCEGAAEAVVEGGITAETIEEAFVDKPAVEKPEAETVAEEAPTAAEETPAAPPAVAEAEIEKPAQEAPVAEEAPPAEPAPEPTPEPAPEPANEPAMEPAGGIQQEEDKAEPTEGA